MFPFAFVFSCLSPFLPLTTSPPADTPVAPGKTEAQKDTPALPQRNTGGTPVSSVAPVLPTLPDAQANGQSSPPAQETSRPAPASQTASQGAGPVSPAYYQPGSPTPPPLNRAGYQVFGTLRLREEDYNWFPANKANGAYTFLGGFARVGVSRATRTEDFVAEFAAPFLAGLPTQAIASGSAGSLGQGASYEGANHNQVASFYLKQGYVRFKNAGNPANTVRLGRFEATDGLETVSADPSLAWIKQNRIGQRLISPSIYTNIGRSFDGIQVVNNTRLRNITAAFLLPTRGNYDLNGWDTLSDIRLGYLAATYPQPGPHASGEGRLFALLYNDSRDGGVVKVDNRPLTNAQNQPVRAGDKGAITFLTLGGNYERVEPLGNGKVDGMVWGAGQMGRWGSLRHGAFAFVAEAGYQPPLPALKPWLRVGYNYYSGDGNANDAIHGTFTAPEYTSRTFARFPFFNQANLEDIFAQLLLRPTPRVSIRADAHGLRLAQSQDLWYSGNGAYEIHNFGFTGRPSNGHSNLANLYDISVDYQAYHALTLSLYFAYADGGDVISAIYRGHEATFAYAEATYHF